MTKKEMIGMLHHACMCLVGDPDIHQAIIKISVVIEELEKDEKNEKEKTKKA